MKIFVAGATGAVGSRLVPLLVASGHEVVGTTRSEAKGERLRKAGADAEVLDVLDRDAVARAVERTRPEVIVHEATALAGGIDLRHFDRSFATTNRLRTEGTANLLAAAASAGTRRLVAQSYAGWPYARVGGPVKTEDDPLDDDPPAGCAQTMRAIRELESAVLGAHAGAGVEGTALRYGPLYGPGTSLGPGGEHTEMVRRRRFPLVGDGGGVWSFVHVDDAAAATLAAIESDATGLYNVVDDEPARVADWLPYLAAAVGGRPPRRVPVWLARLLVGEVAVASMTSVRGASNAKAKRELGWHPLYPTWRTGFAASLAGVGAGVAPAA